MSLASLTAFGQTASSGISGFVGLEPSSMKTQFCDPGLANMCFSQFTTSDKIVYRVAIPDTAVATAPYDILVSITAPSNVGWAGVAWSGGMVGDPLTVAWPSPNGPVVTTRLATEHAPGKPDNDTSTTLLPSSMINGTHWRADVLCRGCSAWTSPDGTKGKVDPASKSVLAYAANTAPNTVTTPTSDKSPFAIHSTLGTWKNDFVLAKNKNFDAMIAQVMAKAMPGQSAAMSGQLASNSPETKPASETLPNSTAAKAPKKKRVVRHF